MSGFVPGDARSPEGFLGSILQRLTSVERRIRPIPARLSPEGQEVTDADDAIAAGFYWASSTAANLPMVADMSIVATPGEGGDVVQLARRTDATTAAQALRFWTRLWDGASWTAWFERDGDTGWQNLSSYLIGGFTGTFEGRVIGNRVYLRGALTGTITTGTTVTEFASGVPAAYRPASINATGGGYVSGMSVVVISRPAGTCAFGNRLAVTGSNPQFTMSYLVD